MNLSHDQIAALAQIKNLFHADYREQILTGSPGTGKSFLTSEVIKLARDENYQLILAATTHPAVKVLSNFTGEHCVTLHKLLDLKVITDYRTNETHTKQQIGRDGPQIEMLSDPYYPSLLIIDEASYIDEAMHGYIKRALKIYPKMVILYVGDQDQLPPVGSEVPHIFIQNIPKNILTTDHRFDPASQMAGIVKQLKTNIQDKSYFLVNIHTGHNISVVNDADLMSVMHDLYTSDEYAENPYHVKTMAYRNKVVDNINAHVRGYFYQDKTYQPGERLIVNSTMVRKRKVLANNGDIVTVMSNVPADIRGVTGQNLMLRPLIGKPFSAVVTTRYQKKNIERKKLVDEANWTALYNFMESFIELKDMYASTIHKAQGATYTNVVLHLDDLVDCKDHTLLARLLLVAVSRASEHVYVYGGIPKHLMR